MLIYTAVNPFGADGRWPQEEGSDLISLLQKEERPAALRTSRCGCGYRAVPHFDIQFFVLPLKSPKGLPYTVYHARYHTPSDYFQSTGQYISPNQEGCTQRKWWLSKELVEIFP